MIRFAWMAAAALAVSAAPAPVAAQAAAQDAAWMALPNGWKLGDVSAVDVDRQGRIWVLQRPRTLAAEDRAHAAPPVLVFDATGKYLFGFGGDGAGYEWPSSEHSLEIDEQGHVWIAGNSRPAGKPGDDMILEFDGKGKFVRQIGRRGASTGDADTANVHGPADLFVDDAAHELYVADGYANHRIIVFDTRTGAFKRMWGAYGSKPPVEPKPGAPATSSETAPNFSGVHGVEISRDGEVYVSDRNNSRIQVFTKQGRYLRQVSVSRDDANPQTASGIALSPDKAQRTLYVADFSHNRLLAFDRKTLKLIGPLAGTFVTPHLIAIDAQGRVYVAEVQGRRVQRVSPNR